MRIVCALGLTVAASAALAASDFEVTSSNVPAYPAKLQLRKGARINLPDGGEIYFIDRTGGTVATRKCAGKYEGPVDKCRSRTSHSGPEVPAGTAATRAPRKLPAPQQ